MDLHRVRRIAAVLLASQLRSGRSLSDPRGFFGRPLVLYVIDLVLFGFFFGAGYLLLRPFADVVPTPVVALVGQLLAFLPLVSVGTVLIAGIMFEFSTGSRFAASDTVNWLPVTPTEYVVASSLAVALVYSPPVAFVLGVAGAVAVALGFGPLFLLSAALALLGLLEGGVLIEVLRALTQRASVALSGRRGRVTLALRAVMLLLVILLFELAFNPLILLGLLGAFGGLVQASAFIPFFWGTRSVADAAAGFAIGSVAFGVASVAFIGLLFYLAGEVRRRFWSPAPVEVRLEAHAFGQGHGTIARFGLTGPEASLVWKDWVGLTRRREMLPMLVVPIVLAMVGFLQLSTAGGGAGAPIAWWGAWVSGFFAFMLSSSSLGQERRSIQTLFAYPVNGRSLFRAKLVLGFLLPLMLGVAENGAIDAIYRPPALTLAVSAVTTLACILAGLFVGLAVATRYSDFQDRPRPQFVRPWAMLGGMGAGSLLIFAMVVPVSAWADSASLFAFPTVVLVLGPAVLATVALPLTYLLARRGADHFFDELPT